MKFEHLIEINNPANPMIDIMTREQLWKGLLIRVETPRLFLPQLDACEIVSRTDNTLSRHLRFGNLHLRDEVTLTELHEMRFVIPAQGDIVASSLIISIEEPHPEHLFVRFVYEDATPDDSPDAAYEKYRHSAYYEADLDMIRLIRRLTVPNNSVN